MCVAKLRTATTTWCPRVQFSFVVDKRQSQRMADAPRLWKNHPHVGYFAHATPARPNVAVVANGMGRIALTADGAGGSASAGKSADAREDASAGSACCWWTSPHVLDRSNPYIGYLAHSRSTSDLGHVFVQQTTSRDAPNKAQQGTKHGTSTK